MSTPTFMLEAPCSRIDPEIMFPNPRDAKGIKLAKSTCGRCPFTAQCLERSLDPATRCDSGVFGGLTEDERKKLIRTRKLGRAVPINYGPIPPKSRRMKVAAAA
ncbi:WhiB family transcriptional regulator [Streptomyces tirandamycinicus]|uniref:WhiB family transcriptional regulator n=1 Tax=Streptomyces tirandamycinicus TaxID=2174846 RepID=UPI00142DC277|nr:WhiB family transcriptional regulator [Streptomyces tirandamycinicus]